MTMKRFFEAPSRRGLRGAPRRSRRGITLFGVILGVGVAAVATLGVVELYSSIQAGQNLTRLVQLNGGLVQGARSLYAGTPTYSDIEASMLVTSGAVPPGNIGPSNTIVDPFGTAVTVTAVASLGGVAEGAFEITYSDLSESACEDFGAGLVGQNRRSSGLERIVFGGHTEDLGGASVMTLAELTAGCTDADNAVVLTYN